MESNQSQGTRKLAAIMFTDIAGYTALTERDEATAIRVRERHRALLQPLVTQFEGELVDATGDESLSSFPSALLAVDCALAIQAVLRDDPDLRLRIGIHVGDVVQQRNEIMGEGVNVASRIRPLARPGGICVSDSVYRLVRSRPHVTATSLGEQKFKNVSQPVEVYALATASQPVEQPSRLRRVGLVAAGIATTLALGYAAYLPNRAVVLSNVAIWAPRLIGNPIEQKLGFATTSDGVRIAYATTGEGSPLVFVLGWATHLERGIGSPLYDGAGWISALSAKHLLVRYDGRGFGLSDRDVDDFSLDARVRDLETVADALGLERFPVFAVSAGGPTAIAFTVRHPERVSRLVLAGTGAALLPPSKDAASGESGMGHISPEQWKGMIALFRTSWDSPVVRSMMTEFLDPGGDEVGQRVASEFLRLSGDGPAIAGFFEALLQTDTRDLARRIRIPVLVIHGQNDETIPLEAGRDLASLVPGARFEILKGANHRTGTIGSPQIAQMINEFLAEDTAAPETSPGE